MHRRHAHFLTAGTIVTWAIGLGIAALFATGALAGNVFEYGGMGEPAFTGAGVTPARPVEMSGTPGAVHPVRAVEYTYGTPTPKTQGSWWSWEMPHEAISTTLTMRLMYTTPATTGIMCWGTQVCVAAQGDSMAPVGGSVACSSTGTTSMTPGSPANALRIGALPLTAPISPASRHTRVRLERVFPTSGCINTVTDTVFLHYVWMEYAST